MFSPIKYDKFLYFLKRKWNAEIIDLILCISLFAIKLLLSFDSIGSFSWIFFLSFFIQGYALIFIKKIKKKMKKHYTMVYAVNFISYLSILYISMDTNSNFVFFYGLEAMIIIYFNFSNIPHRVLRLTIFGLFTFFFLKKCTNFETSTIEILHFIYFMFAIEISLLNLAKAKNNKRKEKKKKVDLNLIVKPEKMKKSLSIFTPSKGPESFQQQAYFTAKAPKEKHNLLKESIPKTMINQIKIGVVLINQDFDIVFTNDILIELFQTEDLEEAKIKFFDLEENIEIAKNDIVPIPEIEFQNFFKKALLFPESFCSFKMDELSENRKQREIISEETLPKFKIESSFSSKDELDNPFKKWKKKQFNNNLGSHFFEVDKKSSDPQTVHSFLEKLFEHIKQEQQYSSKYIPRSDSQRKKEKKKYSMYVNYKSAKEGRDFFIFINFIPIEKNFDSSSQHEILITIRKSSDLEAKYINESKSKDKMLGSFCHELRTPINGIINMLDLLQSQNEEAKQSKECMEAGFDDLLSSAVISSHLLLNEIDDFIDYFSHLNEILEPHLNPLDFQAFFQEINRIFSYIAKKKGIELITDFDGNIPLIIYNDQQRLRQILYNLLNNSLRFTNSGFIKISAALKKNNFIRISVLDTGSGIKSADLDSLGNLNANIHDTKRSTCGLGLFMTNLFCSIIEGCTSDRRKGLTVYSEYGTGTCFSFYLYCGDLSNKLGNIRKVSSSEFFMNTNKNSKKISSSEEKVLSVSSKEGILTSSLLSDRDGLKNIKIFERNKNTLQKNREKTSLKNLKLLVPGNEDAISNRSIFLKKIEVEVKRPLAKFFGQSPHSLISLSTIGKMESSLQLKIDNMKCNCTKILIVDDVAFNIDVCCKLLKKMNLEADCAYNGLEAVEKVKNRLNNDFNFEYNYPEGKNKPERIERKFCEKCKFYKIILMDIDMPLMNGIEATEEIMEILRKFNIPVSIIGLSAFDQEQVKDKAIRAGMKEYVTKPITFKKMNQIIISYI